MTSRRKFIKAAGVLSGLSALPMLGSSKEKSSYSINLSEAANDDELFALVRKQLLVPENRIYLNTGSLGPSPANVIEAQTAALRQLEMNPVSENWPC